MDEFYDRKLAGSLLETHIQGRQSCEHRMTSVKEMFTSTPPNAYKIVPDGLVHRLVTVEQNEAQTEMNEVVASIQGIVCALDIAPIHSKIAINHPNNSRMNANSLKYLRQHISLTSLHTNALDPVYHSIAEIYQMFKLEVGPSLEPSTLFDNFEEYQAVGMHNRYLTPKANAYPADIRPIDKTVDPFGYLLSAAGNQYCYTQDNVVEYYKRRDSCLEGEYSFENCKPTIFQIGDVVEVQVAFAALPLRGNKHRLSMVLRSVSLLDNAVSKRAAILRATRKTTPNKLSPRSLIKRKVGYADEELGTTRGKLAAMQLDPKTPNPQ